jgi:alanyl aminopeptidase
MFEAYLGPAVFQKGVRDYLSAKAWGNATSNDFAAAISNASGKPVEAAFSSFLDQAGTPELTTTIDCKGPRAKLTLAQKRYLPPGSATPAVGTPWTLPICVVYDKGGARGEACTLLAATTGTIDLEARCPRWVLPNANGRGYYRSAYTSAQVTALRDEAWPVLTWTERRALHFDVASSVTTGALPLQLGLSFVPKLLVGNDRFTVPPALELVEGLSVLVPDELRSKYESWVRTSFGPGARQVGLTPRAADSIDVEAIRKDLIRAVAWHGREPVLVAEAVALAASWRDLPQSIRSLVLVIAVDARPEIFDRILRDAPSESDRRRRQEMYAALAEVRDPARQRAALALLIDQRADIRETMDMLDAASLPANRLVAQQFFREHQDSILARLPKDETTEPLAGYARVFTSTCKADQREAIAAYVLRTFGKLPGGELVVKQELEEMDQCIARRAVLEPELRAWLGGLRIPKPRT